MHKMCEIGHRILPFSYNSSHKLPKMTFVIVADFLPNTSVHVCVIFIKLRGKMLKLNPINPELHVATIYPIL